MLETLTAIAGRQSGNDFYSYLAPAKLQQLGLGSKQDTKSVREVIKRISELGNSTKHHEKAASFNGTQLANDVETMTPMLLALAKNAKSKA